MFFTYLGLSYIFNLFQVSFLIIYEYANWLQIKIRKIFNDMTVHPKIKNEIRQIHQLISTTNEERVLLNAAPIFYDIKEFPSCMKTMLDAVPYSICHRLIFIQLSTKGYHNSFIHLFRL